jgi:hypothetical protein
MVREFGKLEQAANSDYLNKNTLTDRWYATRHGCAFSLGARIIKRQIVIAFSGEDWLRGCEEPPRGSRIVTSNKMATISQSWRVYWKASLAYPVSSALKRTLQPFGVAGTRDRVLDEAARMG